MLPQHLIAILAMQPFLLHLILVIHANQQSDLLQVML